MKIQKKILKMQEKNFNLREHSEDFSLDDDDRSFFVNAETHKKSLL